MVKFNDGDDQKMGEIYERMNSILCKIKDIMASGIYDRYFPDVEEIVLRRWEKMNIPMHCLAFALTLRFYDRVYLS